HSLIEEYLDDKLSDTEREQFAQHFLISPDRKEELRITQALQKYAGENNTQTVKEFSKKRQSFFTWPQLFASPPLRYAVIGLVIFGIGFGIWRIGFYQSEVDKGLAKLHLAYRQQRSIKARIVGFDYVPETRGASDNSPEIARAGQDAE